MGFFSELSRLLSAHPTCMALTNMLGPAILDTHRPEVAPDKPTSTDQPTNTDEPTSAEKPTNTDKATNTGMPTNTDQPTNTDGPTNTDQPTNIALSSLPAAFPHSAPVASDQAKQAFQPISLNELPCLCIDSLVFFLMHNKTSLASVEQWRSSQGLVQWGAGARARLIQNFEGLKALAAAHSAQDPDPVQISKQLTQLLGCSEARMLLHAFAKLEWGMAELVSKPKSEAAPSRLTAQVVRAFREPFGSLHESSVQPAPPTPIIDTFSAAYVQGLDDQADTDALVPAAAQAEAAEHAAAEQGAAVADAVHTAALVEDILAMDPRPKEDIVQDVLAMAAVSKPQENPCYKIARSIALQIDPPSPYERLLGHLSDEHGAVDAFANGTPAGGAKKPKVAQLKAACKESGLAVSGTLAQLCGRLKQHEDQNHRHAGSLGAGLRDSTIEDAKKRRCQNKEMAAAGHRREQLQQALKARRPWLIIRSDSQMCSSYIYGTPLGRDKRMPSLEEVVDAVEQQDWLYNKTDYARQLQEARRADHDSGEEEDSEEEELMEADRREGAKLMAVLNWVNRHAAEDIPTLPRALQSKARKWNESKMKDHNSKLHKVHNKKGG